MSESASGVLVGLSFEVQEKESPVREAARSIRLALSDRNGRYSVVANFRFLWAEAGVVSFLTLQLTRQAGLSLAAAVSGASGITGGMGQSSGARSRITRAASSLLASSPFRNSPFPVMYASIIDAVPEGASSGLGLMIGVGLGASGFVAATVADYIIQHFGFTWHYVFLAAICLLTLVPISLIRETALVPQEA